MKSYKSIFRSKSNLVFTCEHASGRIPKQFGKLGLSAKQLKDAKDLYDPGCLKVAQNLAKHFNASLVYSTVSRLVVDSNRRLDMTGTADNKHHAPAVKHHLVVGNDNHDELINIPDNLNLGYKNEKQRFNEIVLPYQQEGFNIVEKLLEYHERVIVMSIHSFFPLYHGHHRKTEIDVMYDKSHSLGKVLFNFLKNNSSYEIGNNEPWSLKDADGGIFNKLQSQKQVSLLALDINNKLLRSKASSDKVSKVIIKAVDQILF